MGIVMNEYIELHDDKVNQLIINIVTIASLEPYENGVCVYSTFISIHNSGQNVYGYLHLI